MTEDDKAVAITRMQLATNATEPIDACRKSTDQAFCSPAQHIAEHAGVIDTAALSP